MGEASKVSVNDRSFLLVVTRVLSEISLTMTKALVRVSWWCTAFEVLCKCGHCVQLMSTETFSLCYHYFCFSVSNAKCFVIDVPETR